MSDAYFQRVRESALNDVATAGAGDRNTSLNKAAFNIGRHAHLTTQDGVEGALSDLVIQAKALGLHENEIKATITSGFREGGNNKKEIENYNAEPFVRSDWDRLLDRMASKHVLLKETKTREEKIAEAQKIYSEALPLNYINQEQIRPTLLYLQSRGIEARFAEKVAKHHSNIYGGPAVIFPACDVAGQVQGVQSVLIDDAGQKRKHNEISKYSKGALKSNVMIINTPKVGGKIILTEGPEDALSAAQACEGEYDASIVCSFGKSLMGQYTPPEENEVVVCTDPDLDVDKIYNSLKEKCLKIKFVRFDQEGIDNVKDANDYLRYAGQKKFVQVLNDTPYYEPEPYNWPTPFTFIDPAQIPKRRWIYGTHYIRKFISVVASAGGIGKTSMQTVEALAISTGRDLLGEKVKERCNVWIINLEDPMEEMQRRFAAAMMHYQIKPEDVAGRLFIDAGRDMQLKFATSTRDGTQTNQVLEDYMIKKIIENEIGLVIVDPWVGANDIPENDNSAMEKAVSAARRVCDATDCAIVITHHIRKQNGEDATVDSVRGAGSLISAARAARVINRISKEEAEKMGVDEMQSTGIFRVDDAKANLAPPPDKALYRRMHGVELPNGENIGVCTSFHMPDLFEGIKASDLMAVQRLIGTAIDENDPYRESANAKRWAGFAVAKVLNLDMQKASQRARVKSVLRHWLQNDALQVTEFDDRRAGRKTKIYEVKEWVTREEAGL